MDHPWFGRKGASAAFLSLVSVAIGVGALVPSVAVACSMVGTFAAEAFFALLYLQVQELFPTPMRSTAIGLCSAGSRAANLLSAPMPIVLGSELTLAFIGTICAFALPFALCALPETRGRSLA